MPKDKYWDELYGPRRLRKTMFSVPKGDPEAAAIALRANLNPLELAAMLNILRPTEQNGGGSDGENV